MSSIQKFTDLECWQSARKTTNMIYDIFGDLRDFAYRDQILRAAISVMNNIAEWFWKSSTKDRIRYLDISIWSLNEIQSMLYLGFDRKYITEEQLQSLLLQTTETMNLTYWFRRYLEKLLT